MFLQHCDPSHVLWESLIIKIRLSVLEQQCTLYHIWIHKLVCDCEWKLELYNFWVLHNFTSQFIYGLCVETMRWMLVTFIKTTEVGRTFGWQCKHENSFWQLLTFLSVNKDNNSCGYWMANCFSANFHSGEFALKGTKYHILRSHCYIWKYIFPFRDQVRHMRTSSFPSITPPVFIWLSSWVIPCLLPPCTG